MAPSRPEAASFRDIEIGRFDGPSGVAVESAFRSLLSDTHLDGQPWFRISAGPPDGIYEGAARTMRFEVERRHKLEKKCVEYDGLFDCETRAFVEQVCDTERVIAEVSLSLINYRTGRHVFTEKREGDASETSCRDLREVPDRGQSEGEFGPTETIVLSPLDAPPDLADEAAVEAVADFREVIAPYNQTVRAVIVEKGILPEEANDTRFAAAVAATKSGNPLAACADWDALAKVWPEGPATLHNLGACAEARGDLETAQSLYGKAAEIIRTQAGLKDSQRKIIFDSLARVSGRRADGELIERVTNTGGS
jgi:tetratricopeptide (TPR) repeat protein